MRSLVIVLVSTILLLLSTEAEIVCPLRDSYVPCYCGESSSNPDNIYLNCYAKSLTDSMVSDILDSFLTTPGISSLDYVDLSVNQLTRVPDQIRYFPQLTNLDLSNNKLTAIETGGLNISSISISNLYLENNQLTTIAPGVFQGFSF